VTGTFEEARSYLYSLERRGVRLGLDRVCGAFRDFGDPQEAFVSVLIAGTNGKGSTAAFTASCLQAGGWKTGLFTSPHLVDFRERIRIDGRMIPAPTVAELTDRARPAIEKWELSFFEATTLIAFLWFRESGVDAAAVEVGLGGRLDATRPVRSLVNVVTSISLDHEKILGDTRSAIAREKAGIFRAGIPVVLGVSAADAVHVLRARARDVGAPLHERRRLLRVTAIRSDEKGSRFRVEQRRAGSIDFEGQALFGDGLDLQVPLAGRHQVANAVLACLALSLLPPPMRIAPEALQAGLRRARWPGRCEILSECPRIICDVGHNPSGAASLARALRFRGETRARFVIGMVEGKDHLRFLSELSPCAIHIHACTPPTDRALPGAEIERLSSVLGVPSSLHGSPAEALESALSSGDPEFPIVITGSFYTVGSAMDRLGFCLPDPLWPPNRG
jgi:dihydrofolate synthase / folylpolyglutamate synthase